MVMMIIAIATTLAVYISSQQNLWQRQVESQFDHAQARRVGIAAIDWARAVLADDARTTQTDHDAEMWTLRLPAMQVENGEVIGVIEDQQGLFNLNNLTRGGSTSSADVAQFQRLLATLGLPEDLACTLADWMDGDSDAQAGGAEDAYYLGLPRPYRAANRPLTDIDELIWVKGYNSAIIEQLRPFVTALPQPGPINVNFAPPEVLAAVAENMGLADARLLAQQRSGHPFSDIADFQRRLPRQGIRVSSTDISVNSNFFKATGRVTIGHAQVMAQALLWRATAWPDVVWQKIQ